MLKLFHKVDDTYIMQVNTLENIKTELQLGLLLKYGNNDFVDIGGVQAIAYGQAASYILGQVVTIYQIIGWESDTTNDNGERLFFTIPQSNQLR